MIEHCLITIASGIGLATLIVEKGDEFPLKYIKNILIAATSLFLGERISKVFNCTVCLSFWTTLLCELFSYYLLTGHFTWPLSGFAACGICFYLIDFLNTLEKRG
jgi:hypothetical protein